MFDWISTSSTHQSSDVDDFNDTSTFKTREVREKKLLDITTLASSSLDPLIMKINGLNWKASEGKNYVKKEKKNHRRRIQREFEHVGPTLLKNPFDAGWALLPPLRWVWAFVCKQIKNKLKWSIRWCYVEDVLFPYPIRSPHVSNGYAVINLYVIKFAASI